MAGLSHPEDLAAWQAWQARLHPLRRLKAGLRPPPAAPLRLTVGGGAPRLLVVVESLSPSNRAASLGPLAHLPLQDVAVLSAGDVVQALPEHSWSVHHDVEPRLTTGLRAVFAHGHYTELGHRAWVLSRRQGVPFLVAQHGLMTPLAPPLPEDAHLLAWSEADAHFWWSGRGGQSTVVGSQLLWEAGNDPVTEVLAEVPTYLGQLHGAELPRRDLARAAGAFCRAHGATYRPHPSESDRLSRWQHSRWERKGITVDRSGVPLGELGHPVVSVFSTGVLEAAARGIPAWVDFPDPTAWLEEFWERYDMRPYGGDPTPAPVRAATEPAAAVADILRSHL